MTRRGFALAAVLFALVLLAALTAAGFFASLQEVRAGRNSGAMVRAQSAATSAIAAVIGGWDPRAMNVVPPGATTFPPLPPSPGVSLSVAARRLSPGLFLLRADATFNAATRSVAVLVRLRGVDVQPLVAARVRSVDAAIVPRLSGVDQAPQGWACPATADTIPALMAQPNDSDAVFFQFGDRDWASLVAWADGVPPGGDSLTVTHVAGNMSIGATRTLGVLIVDGDLTLSGGAEVVGIVIVHGSLVLQGSGGAIFGAVVASQLVTGQGYTPSGPVVTFSSCAALAAAVSRAYPEAVPGQPPVTFY